MQLDPYNLHCSPINNNLCGGAWTLFLTANSWLNCMYCHRDTMFLLLPGAARRIDFAANIDFENYVGESIASCPSLFHFSIQHLFPVHYTRLPTESANIVFENVVVQKIQILYPLSMASHPQYALHSMPFLYYYLHFTVHQKFYVIALLLGLEVSCCNIECT